MFDRDNFLDEMDKLIALSSGTKLFMNVSCRYWKPSTNIYETAESFIVVLELAGVSKQDVSVTVRDSRLIIHGRRNIPVKASRLRPLRMELDSGLFLRTINLAGGIEETHIDAQLTDGILTITLPKMKRSS